MVTFSKRRKGLFKKAQELSFKTGAKVAILVFSPTGKPYTFADLDSGAVAESFGGCFPTTITTALRGNNDGVDHHVNGGGNFKQWVENINVEDCNNVDELMFLKQKFEEARENLMAMMVDDSMFVQNSIDNLEVESLDFY